MCAGFIYNRKRTHVLAGKSSFEVLYSSSLEYHKMHVFVCRAYPNLLPYRQGKLDPISVAHFFLGYLAANDRYIMLHPRNNRVMFSRNVTFLEHDFMLS